MRFFRKILGMFVFFAKCFRVSVKTILKGNRVKKIKMNKEVVLICNGPSLNDIDIRKIIKNREIAVVNDFAIYHDIFFEMKPMFYVLIDPAYFDSNIKHNNEINKRLFEIFERIDWKMTLVTVQKASFKFANKNIRIERLSNYEIYANSHPKIACFFYKRNLATCGLQNVAIASLFYFIFRGAPVIYLCGVDMSEFLCFSINENNEVIKSTKHSYGDNIFNLTKMGIVKKGEFCFLLDCYSIMLKQFYNLSHFASMNGVKVLNLSPQSFVDVFEKKDWKDI